MRTIRLACAVLAVLLVAGALAAQLPAKTTYLASVFSYRNALVAFDGSGNPLTTVNLTGGGGSPDSLGMAPTNDSVLVFDTVGVWNYDVNTGSLVFVSLQTSTTSLQRVLQWGVVDEDAGMVWCTNAGQVFRAADTSGTSTTLLANVGGLANSICVNHATGGYVVVIFAGSSRVIFLSRTGTVVRTAGPITVMSGVDFNPWDGNLYVSRFGGSTAGVMRVTQSGTTTSVTAGSVATATNNSVEVFDQPFNQLLCSEFGGSPQHLTLIDPTTGAITTLHSSSGVLGFSDAEIFRARKLWATGPWKVGAAGPLSVNFGPLRGGQGYMVALSLGYSPGIPLGAVGTLHLAVDGLFIASITIGPPIFNNFAGVLNTAGAASPAPFVRIPNIPQLRGIRVYGGAIAFSRTGITDVSNLWGITIE